MTKIYVYNIHFKATNYKKKKNLHTQVEFLFSDKTGTLTENIMSFRRCSVGGRNYVDAEGRLHEASTNNGYSAGRALASLPVGSMW